MIRTFLVALVPSAVFALSPAFAQQNGTREEAKAMLMKTVAAIKADKAKAIEAINKAEGGFLDRDLYPFCFNASDGIIVAVAAPAAKANIGKDERTSKDANGKPFGLEVYNAAQKAEGVITEVEYVFPKPSDPKPAPKLAFVTRVGDLGCGSGYYK